MIPDGLKENLLLPDADVLVDALEQLLAKVQRKHVEHVGQKHDRQRRQTQLATGN